MSKPVKSPPSPLPHAYWVLSRRLLAGEYEAETQ
jgi:hypothetical protein